jgi:penicillin-binding protein 1A
MLVAVSEPPNGENPSPETPPDLTSGLRGRLPSTGWLIALSSLIVIPLVLLSLLHLALNRPPLSITLQREAARAIAARLPGAGFGAVHVGFFGAIALRGFEVPGPERDGPAMLTADRLIVHPSWIDLLRGHLRVDSLELRWVRLHPGPSASWLKQLWHRSQTATGDRHRSGDAGDQSPSELVVRDLFIDLPFSGAGGTGATLTLGPLRVDAHWHRSETDWSFQLEGDLLDGEGGRFAATGRRTDRGDVLIDGHVDKLLVADLPPELMRRSDIELTEGRFSGRLAGTFEAGGAAEGTLEGQLDQGKLTWPRLAEGPVAMQLTLSGDYRWVPPERTVYLRHGRIGIGSAQAEIDGALSLALPPTLEIEVRLVHQELQAAIDGLPEQLRPPPEAPRVEGDLSADVAVRFELGHPDSLQLRRADLDLSTLAKAGGDNWMRHPFLFQPAQTEENPRAFEVGPGNPHFVALSTIPEVLIRAVLLSEDAGFYAHHGFDFDEIRDSLGRDLAEGQAVRGASTLSQQLVKNLFLSREKTLARKIQEALITLQMEASVPKGRILEIYLNTIEWGPRVYGIGEASERYFHVRPDRLTAKQAAFLATIIPNPRRFYHLYYERGALTPRWEERVEMLLAKMRETGVIDVATFEEAMTAPLVFADRGDRGGDRGADRSEREGGATQIRTGE